jgi:hypothetical protein
MLTYDDAGHVRRREHSRRHAKSLAAIRLDGFTGLGIAMISFVAGPDQLNV